MNRPVVRLLLFFVSAALLAGFLTSATRADGPALTAKFGIAGRYKPGGWCLVTIGVTNPGPDTLSGQVQVVAANTDNGPSPFGRRGGRANTFSAVFACPVSVPGGTTSPRTFPMYVRGIDPGQADLAVQLVEGRERGDGRVLAKISNQNPNEAAAFSGSAVSPTDTLLIGFGGDPGAFLFLNGRSLGAATAPGVFPPPRFAPNAVTPATVQVAEAQAAADLPDNAAGYAGADAFLLRSDAPLDALTEAQTNALRSWVASGGHLLVCGGGDPARYSTPFFAGLLPATVSEAGASGLPALTPKPLPGVHAVAASPGHWPASVIGPYGAGSVTLTASDPTESAFQAANASNMPLVWHSLLSGLHDPSASVLAVTAQREENTNAFYFGSAPPLLSQAVMRGPSLDAPGTSVIAIFLLAYLVILVPVNYLVLKRLDRKEWAWGTIPALVLLFAAGTFGVGYAAKGGSVFVNRSALIETSAGRREAGVYSEVGLFSPRRSSYDIDLAGDGLVSAIPNPGTDYSGRGGDTQGAGSVQFVETPAGASLPNTPVNMWAMRAFDAQSTIDLGGTIDASLSDRTGLTGTIINRTPDTLTDCAVYYQGRWVFLGSLAPGVTLTVPGVGVSRVQTGEFSLPLPPAAQAEVHARMQASLAGYCRSLGERQPSYNGMNTRLNYMPSNDEALFVGWSRDPKLAGPIPKIDGGAVTENDETLVIVHVPVK